MQRPTLALARYDVVRLLLGLIAALMLTTPGAAVAADAGAASPAEALAAAEGVIGHAIASPALTDDGEALTLSQSDDTFVAPDAGQGVTIGEGADAALDVATRAGSLKLVPLDVADDAGDGVLMHGASVVYLGTQSSTDTIVRPTADGLETFMSIRSATAPEAFRYRVALPAGQHLIETAAGGVAVVADASSSPAALDSDADQPVDPAWAEELPAIPLADDMAPLPADLEVSEQRVIAVIPPVWAQDATGRPVEVQLDVDGDVLVLTVDHRRDDVRYPVVADPEVDAVAAGDATSVASANGTSLPTWRDLYDWPNGHGYVGFETAGDSSRYTFATGLPSGAGLWVWPSGGQTYPAGDASWRFDAPGTTRAMRATVDLAYPPRLLSHHCVAISFVDSSGSSRNETRFCKPPQAPRANPALVRLDLSDPAVTAPLTKRVALKIELPCATGDSCQKSIPVAEAIKDGLQIRRVDMTLVDDDLPTLAPAGPFWDLRDSYIDGKQTYPLTVSAADAGAGLTRTGFEEPASGELYTHDVACDPTHHTQELGARICPPTSETATTVDTRPMPEGKHLFRETATDLAGNMGASSLWAVFVDRTPPAVPDLTFTSPEEGSAQATWTVSADPDLRDGSPGSGLAGYRVRSRIADGAWSDWQTLGADATTSEDIFDQPAGTTVAFDVASVDQVGNVSDAATVVGQVPGEPPALYTTGPLSDAADGYLPAGQFTIDVSADDGEGSGVRTLVFDGDGVDEQTAASGCLPQVRPDGRPWKAICPQTAAATFSVDTSTMPEGHRTFEAAAIDRAGNRASRAWNVVVDKTAPSVPENGIKAVFSDITGDTDIFWPNAVDGQLADGSAGSGVAGYDVRYRRAGADWTDWQQTDTETFGVEDSHEGEQIDVELRTRDRAGNLSDVVSATVTGETSPYDVGVEFFGADEDARIAVDPATDDASPALAAASIEEGASSTDPDVDVSEDSANTSATPDSTATLTMAEALTTPDGVAALDQASVTAPRAAAESPLNRVVQCKIGKLGGGIPELLDEYAGEERIAIRSQISGYCYPTQNTDESRFAYVNTTLQMQICIQVSDDRDFESGVQTIKCDAMRSKRHPDIDDRLSVEAKELCRPGGTYYRTKLFEKSTSPGFRGSKGTVYTTGYFLGCNEAGAWRREATRDGDAGQILGDALLSPLSADIDRDDLPQSDVGGKRHGWEAHHIVPKDYGRGTTSRDVAAARIQGLAYTCDINPNSAVNGLWLRGRFLYNGTDGYRSLSEFGKRRPEHQPIHTTVHFNWIASHLDNHATSGGTCLSRGGMLDSLRGMKDTIRVGDAPQ